MMTITVTSTLDFVGLYNMCWGEALDTLENIKVEDKEEELMSFLALDAFSSMPDLSEINDLLSFESDYVYEQLGISK